MVLNLRHWASNLISLCGLPENHKTRLTVLQIHGIYFACPSGKELMEKILKPNKQQQRHTPSAEVNAPLYFSTVLQVLCSLCEVQRGTSVRVEPKSENTALWFLQ